MTTNDYSFSESDYRFTSPVRYFTATDPYYWEIDNIPLKQLQENDLWLKDQIEDGFKKLRFSTGRSDFQELLPYSDSVDSIVRVKPGRYTARINDATSDPRLQQLTRVFGKVFDEPNKWRFATLADGELNAIVAKLNSTVGSDALFMNGLTERVFSYSVKNPYEAFDDIEYSEEQAWTYHSPLLKVFFWPGVEYQRTEWWQDQTSWRAEYGMRFLPLIENLFVKFWRGVFRLSVVDVPETLSIEVPPFSQDDFSYYNESGQLIQNTSAETRIDLLFIYSKPIDASQATVKSTEQTNFRTITTPELGLVRGAGLILRKDNENYGGTQTTGETLDEDNNIQILASPADQENTNGGFKALGVRGSFPSPDDLMNVAPLLLESLEASDPRLVGQSVLPIAYIVVRKDAADNEFGEVIVTNNDIIDIRPFFRTAELAYNERAGIAASLPQISISNPVVSDVKLKYVTHEITEDYKARLARLSDRVERIANPTAAARVVGCGFVQGGTRFGAEGAIRDYYSRFQGLDNVESLQRLREVYNFPTQTRASYYPEWDVAPWVPGSARKQYPNDCVNVHIHSDYFGDSGNDDNFDYLGKSAAKNNGAKLDHLFSNSLVFFCKKTIKLDRTQVEWMDHYTVNAHLVNCVPLSHVTDRITNVGQSHAGASHIWVEYRRDEFTIYCAWVGMQNVFTEEAEVSQNFPGFPYTTRFGTPVGVPNSGGSGGTGTPTIYKALFSTGLVTLRDNAEVTAGFTVITQELAGLNRNKAVTGGVCIYPTIKFDIVGYPRYYAGMPSSLYDQDPVLTLV